MNTWLPAWGADIYFAKHYSSWQRGRNENTNGLLREYFPKKMPPHQVQDAVIQKAVSQLNNRPRKTIGCKMPHLARIDLQSTSTSNYF
jgi:transposase, IS30 family